MRISSTCVIAAVFIALVASCKKDAGEACDQPDACAAKLACVGGTCITLEARRQMAGRASTTIAWVRATCKSSSSLGEAHTGIEGAQRKIRDAKLKRKVARKTLSEIARAILSSNAKAKASLVTMKSIGGRVKAALQKNPLLGDALKKAKSSQEMRVMIQRRAMARSPHKQRRVIDQRLGVDYCEPALLSDLDKTLAAAAK